MVQLKRGLRGSVSVVVTNDLSADRFGNPGINVLASPVLAFLFEKAAVQALSEVLEPGLRTVGAGLEFVHKEPTPVGFEVFAEATLIEVQLRRLRFSVFARDDVEEIGVGTHDRFLIDWERFRKSVATKERRRTPRRR